MGSLLGIIANELTLLLIARIIQAAGASFIPRVGMIITNRYIPIHRKGEAMGKIASVTTLGFGIGPLLGGLVSEYVGWMYLFGVTLFALFMLPVYYRQLPREEVPKERFDLIGLVLLCVGAISLLLYISLKKMAV